MFPDFLESSAQTVAPKLLGCVLEREIDGHTVQVRIVETESYDQDDAASHSYRGQTERTKIMFGPSGCLYVYFTYGMHYCCNVVTGPVGRGEAVLIRAVEPINNHEFLEQKRHKVGVDTTNGPAKLCMALGIDQTMNGHDLRQQPLKLLMGDSVGNQDIVTTARVGITKAIDEQRRFYIRGNPYISRE